MLVKAIPTVRFVAIQSRRRGDEFLPVILLTWADALAAIPNPHGLAATVDDLQNTSDVTR